MMELNIELEEGNNPESLFDSQMYDSASLRKPEYVVDIGREALGLYHVFGHDVGRRNNLHLIEDDRVIYASSSAVILEDLKSGKKDYILAIEENGIGCVVVHPSRNFFAVGSRGFQPNIYIYSYPDMKIRKVLRNGAERGYACMSFSADGQKLASVSIAPDYMLTIWDWEQEQMGLHAKAFGQDVWNVQFSVDDPRRLTTSGIGHIRFWKMAATFTGLKLQGSIGKFGKIDLSDIEHFVELPDGKVISGTETGSLLLWEGNFIKCRFVQSNNLPCHDSPITFISFDREEKCIISASLDGKIRWWDFATIDSAEVDSDHSMDFALKPVVEYSLPEGVGIKVLIDSGYLDNSRLFVIVDTLGRGQSLTYSLVPVDGEGNKIFHAKSLKLIDVIRILEDQHNDASSSIARSLVDRKIFSDFHAGAITGVDTCPIDHLAATCGTDGVVRCVDYVNRKIIACRRFPTPATCLKWLGTDIDKSGQSFAVGFADGIIRVLSLGTNLSGEVSLLRRMVFKPHNDAVTEISFSDSGKFIASAGKDGIVFFQRCKPLVQDELNTWDPVRFITISSISTTSKSMQLYCEAISWSPNEKQILLSCNDGICREIDLSGLHEIRIDTVPLSSTAAVENEQQQQSDFEFTYEIQLPNREVSSTVQVMTNSKSGILTLVKPALDNNSETVPSETASPESPSKVKPVDQIPPDPISTVNLRINRAIHSVNRGASGFVASASLSITQHLLCEGNLYDGSSTKELISGVYSVDGKDSLPNPLITSLRYGWSKKYLAVGASDGSLILRPSEYLEVFGRTTVQNGSSRGVGAVALSFDDRYSLSVGKDGCLVVNRVRLDLFSQKSQNLYKDLDAGVFGSELIKQKNSSKALSIPEPRYLSFVSSYIPTDEDSLFAASLIGKKEENILQKSLFNPTEEYPDLAKGAYSIQDNRLKAEEDAKRIAADDLKSRIRASIRTLQKDYEKIVKENDNIPERVRLSSKEMMVDEEFFNLLKFQGQELLNEVHRECMYEAEKSEKLLLKIKSRLMQGLLIEEIPLMAFDINGADPKLKKRQPQSVVFSLRTASLDPAVSKVINQVKAQLRHQELLESQQRSNDIAQKKAMDAMEDMKQRLQQKKDEQSVGPNASIADNKLDGGDGNIGSKVLSSTNHAGAATSASSAIARRIKRKERKDEILKHELQKPSENDDDVRDIQAIKHAEKTMGDYKLKCSDDYEVPEDQRINANKKLKQMAMLEDSMFNMRLQFNERFLTLRHLKQQMIYSIRRNNQRIRDIDRELNQIHLSRVLWEPSLNPEEFPEDYEEVTAEELLEFMNSAQSTSWEKLVAPNHKIVIGNKLEIVRNKKSGSFEVWRKVRDIDSVSESKDQLENFLCDSTLVNFTPSRTEPLKFYEVKECLLNLPPANVCVTMPMIPSTPSTAISHTVSGNSVPYEVSMAELSRLQTLEGNIPILRFTKALIKERMQAVAPSAIQQKLNLQRRQKLEFERTMILSTMNDNINGFREAIDDLRIERHQIIGDLKLAEFKLLTLYQEYQLLQTFEFRDNTLQQKQIRCKNEEAEIVALSYENKMKLESKMEEIQHWNEKLSHLIQEFKSLLPDNHPYLETLTKIFKKKIKRSKGGEDENEDEEEEEEEEEDDDGDDDDDEEVEDICPPGCDQSLFDKILDLREKKLDTEEICSEIQKSIDDLKKTGDRLRQREKQITKETQQTELEVQQFQLQKQAALNQIKVVVPLRLSQIYSFELSGLLTGPTDKPIVSDDHAEKVEDLKSSHNRELVATINMKSHSLFSTKNLIRLKDRINELHQEIEDAKDNFKLLHKERAQLLKDRESKDLETENWKNKCLDLQMLKFGREIDLDELETFSDRTKELEVESILEQDRERFETECQKLMKEVASAKEKLIEVTKENTKLLDEVARLTNLKITIAKDLNAPGQSLAAPTLLEDFREVEERKRIKAYTQFQATELEALRAELNMLKRKEAPIFSYSSPPIPPSVLQSMTGANQTKAKDDLVLPPIPSSKKK